MDKMDGWSPRFKIVSTEVFQQLWAIYELRISENGYRQFFPFFCYLRSTFVWVA